MMKKQTLRSILPYLALILFVALVLFLGWLILGAPVSVTPGGDWFLTN